jgi:aspartyl protease family protein
MPDGQSPWDEPPPPPRSVSGARRWVWLGLLATIVGGLWLLARWFPGQVSGSDWVYPIQDVGYLVLVASAILVAGRVKLIKGVRYLAIWSGVAAVLVLGFAYKGDLMAIGSRIRSQLIPSYPVSLGPHTLALSQSENGGYYVVGAVNGVPVRFLVDTGASDVVLSPADARRLGIDLDGLDYGHSFGTANGVGRGASYTAASLDVGAIRLTDVPMSINQAEMGESLLGMAFLRRLESFEFKDGRLVLRARGS